MLLHRTRRSGLQLAAGMDHQLPDRIDRLSFTLRWRGLRLGVDVQPDRVTYTLRDGTDASLAFRHNGNDVTVAAATPVTLPISKRHPVLPRPPQPPGREPTRRGSRQRVAPAPGPAAFMPSG